jgi:hypothetical protein
MPINPRSPVSSDGRSTNGVGSSCPFSTISSLPLRSRMKIRPSGAIAKPDGPSRPADHQRGLEVFGWGGARRRGGHEPERQEYDDRQQESHRVEWWPAERVYGDLHSI